MGLDQVALLHAFPFKEHAWTESPGIDASRLVQQPHHEQLPPWATTSPRSNSAFSSTFSSHGTVVLWPWDGSWGLWSETWQQQENYVTGDYQSGQ